GSQQGAARPPAHRCGAHGASARGRSREPGRSVAWACRALRGCLLAAGPARRGAREGGGDHVAAGEELLARRALDQREAVPPDGAGDGVALDIEALGLELPHGLRRGGGDYGDEVVVLDGAEAHGPAPRLRWR